MFILHGPQVPRTLQSCGSDGLSVLQFNRTSDWESGAPLLERPTHQICQSPLGQEGPWTQAQTMGS